MTVGKSYEGREQSYLKHRVLEEYLISWAFKLGSKATRLWYIDSFAGPWGSGDEDLADTSVAIGTKALETVRDASRRNLEQMQRRIPPPQGT